MSETTHNLNDRVAVTVTETGRLILEKSYRDFGSEPPELGPNGELTTELWNVMEIFGSAIHIGFDSPIDTTFTIESDQP